MRRWTPYLSLFILFTLAATSFACPMCKDSIADTAKGNFNDPAAQAGLPSGFNFSVYYMLIAVFSMMGLVIGVIAKGIRSTHTRVPRGFDPVERH